MNGTDPLVDAELEILKVLGVGVYRTRSLDGEEPLWNAQFNALLIPTDLTPEDAEEIACEVLGMIAAQLASAS